MNIKVLLETVSGRNNLLDLVISARVMLGGTKQMGCEGVGWIGLAHDRDRWGELVNMALNLRLP
jgi:hypothetical protein